MYNAVTGLYVSLIKYNVFEIPSMKNFLQLTVRSLKDTQIRAQ